MLNRWEGIGNLGKDPETRYTTGQNPTAVCRFTMAVDHGYGERKKTVWMNVVAYGKLAENCQKFLAKGKKVYASGELDIREYERNDGSKGYITETTAKTIEFLSNQEQVQQNQQAMQSNGWPPQTGFSQQPQQQMQPAWSNPQQWTQPQQPAPQQQFPAQDQPISYQQYQQEKQQEQMQIPAGFEQMAANEEIPF